jgi:hypothetical protein
MGNEVWATAARGRPQRHGRAQPVRRRLRRPVQGCGAYDPLNSYEGASEYDRQRPGGLAKWFHLVSQVQQPAANSPGSEIGSPFSMLEP